MNLVKLTFQTLSKQVRVFTQCFFQFLISGKILAKVVEYMLYRQAHVNDLTEEFFIEPELALDMMLAADYLDI